MARLAAKAKVKVWVGHPDAAPQKRANHPSASVVAAAQKWVRRNTAATAAQRVANAQGPCKVDAARSTLAESQGSSASSSAARARPHTAPPAVMFIDDRGCYSHVDVSKIDKASAVVVASHSDLLSQAPSAELLSAWF
jgi:hypothetical protein